MPKKPTYDELKKQLNSLQKKAFVDSKENASSILFRISSAVGTTKDLQEFYREIHEILMRVVDAQNFFIGLIDEDRDRIIFPYAVDKYDKYPDIENISDPEADSLSIRVVRKKKALFLVDKDIIKDNIKFRGTIPKVWIGVPLKIKKKVVGLMAIQHYSDPKYHSKDDIRIMESISEQVALAIERKTNEEALIESESKYRNILDNMVEGYYEVDLKGKFIFVNASICEFLGYSRDEILTMENRQIMSRETAERVFNIFNLVFNTGEKADNFELEFIKKNGESCYIDTSISLIKTAKGEPVGFRGLGRNISWKKIAEQEKDKINAKLHHIQRMESIGTLAGGIAHNFNNILMTIQGYATLMLMDTPVEDKHHKMIKNIEKQVQSGARLTSQLIGYAREGKYEVQTTNLNHLVKETGETFGMTKKEITIDYDFDKKLKGVIADRGQMEQVIMNLFVNAADAMPKGGSLFLETRNVSQDEIPSEKFIPKPGRYVRLIIRDTGFGMDRNTLDHIFEPFFTTKDLSRGSGLGLASAYGIIKAHGGYIMAVSKPEKGATFKIFLPASRGKKIKKIQKDKIIVKGKGVILFVDDDEFIHELGNDLLKVLGYSPLSVMTGKDALKIFEKKKDEIDLVILDMIMPDLSGGDVYDRLKDLDPNVKVLLSSGYSIDGQASEILDRGCNGFIQKPFRLEELSRKINDIIEGKD